jgi:hypothetical protein
MNDANYREARDIAIYLHRRHYLVDAPNWEPLDTLEGVLSQISNMVSGLVREKLND